MAFVPELSTPHSQNGGRARAWKYELSSMPPEFSASAASASAAAPDYNQVPWPDIVMPGGQRQVGYQRPTPHSWSVASGNIDPTITGPEENVRQPKARPERVHGLSEPNARVPTTTMMVRSLPCRIPLQELLRIWPCEEYHYDLFHVPYNLKDKRPARYAFINFATQEWAMAFQARWHGQFLPMPYGGAADEKPLEVITAARQGLVANMLHWETTLSQVQDECLLPAVIRAGKRHNFWAYLAELHWFLNALHNGEVLSV